MKQKIVTLCLAIFVVCNFINKVFCAETINAAAFSKLIVGAKPISCGGAYHSVSGDVNSIFYNPAGLGELKKFEFTTMIGLLSLDRSLNMLGLALPTGIGTIGFGIVNSGVGKINKVDDNGNITDEINYQANNITFAYGKNIESINIGLNFKTLIDNIDNNSRLGIGVDLGLTSNIKNNITLGIKLNNLIGFIGEDQLPLNVVVGAKYNPLKQLSLSSDVLYNLEMKQLNFRAGLQFEITKLLSVGCGVNDRMISFGIGMNINKFNFYYSFSTDQFDVSNLHFITLGLKL